MSFVELNYFFLFIMDPHYLGERGIILEEKIGEGSFG